MRLSLDEGVKFETTIVLGRDSNSVTQSLSSKSIWRRRWSRVSLPIHRVTLSLSLSLLFALGRLLDGSMTTDGRSVVPRWIFTEHQRCRPIRGRSWNRPTSSFCSRNLLPIFQQSDNTSRFFATKTRIWILAKSRREFYWILSSYETT